MVDPIVAALTAGLRVPGVQAGSASGPRSVQPEVRKPEVGGEGDDAGGAGDVVGAPATVVGAIEDVRMTEVATTEVGTAVVGASEPGVLEAHDAAAMTTSPSAARSCFRPITRTIPTGRDTLVEVLAHGPNSSGGRSAQPVQHVDEHPDRQERPGGDGRQLTEGNDPGSQDVARRWKFGPRSGLQHHRWMPIAPGGQTRVRPPGRSGGQDLLVHETRDDLSSLQRLLDRSYAGAGPHLHRVITTERRPTANQLAARLTGMTLLTLATATADGRPIAGPVDGVFYRGAFYFGSSPDSVRFRHIGRRPHVSAVHLPGEGLAVSTHGRAIPIDVRSEGEAGFRRALLEIYTPRYGSEWETFLDSGPIYARLEADRMFTFHMDEPDR